MNFERVRSSNTAACTGSGIAMAQRVSAPFLRKVIGALCIGLGAFLFLRQAGCF